MNIDQTMRPEAQEGEDLIVEELFVEDYGPISAEEAPEQATGLKKKAERVKNVVMRARKPSVFGLLAIAGLMLAGVMFARNRRRSVLARFADRLGIGR